MIKLAVIITLVIGLFGVAPLTVWLNPDDDTEPTPTFHAPVTEPTAVPVKIPDKREAARTALTAFQERLETIKGLRIYPRRPRRRARTRQDSRGKRCHL